MEAKDVEQLVRQHLPECEVQVQSDGNHFLVVAVGGCFEGLNAVKRQQMIYAALQAPLADGSIHALTIKAFTPAQWAEQKA